MLLDFRCRNQSQQVEAECLEETTGLVPAPGVFLLQEFTAWFAEVWKTWACSYAAESQGFLEYVGIYLALKVFDMFIDRYRGGHRKSWLSVTGGGQSRGWFRNCYSRWGRSICRGRSSVVWRDVGRDWSWHYYCRSHGCCAVLMPKPHGSDDWEVPHSPVQRLSPLDSGSRRRSENPAHLDADPPWSYCGGQTCRCAFQAALCWRPWSRKGCSGRELQRCRGASSRCGRPAGSFSSRHRRQHIDTRDPS